MSSPLHSSRQSSIAIMSLLRISAASVAMDRRQVLRDITFCLQPGERVAVMGASGAGKSTFLRLAAGLVTPTAGLVLLRDKPIQQLPPSERSIGLLTQDYSLYPQLSIAENLRIGLMRTAVSQSEVDHRCKQVAGWFEIETILSRYPEQISGGQAQRVAFAKTLVRQPDLLLLDEPISQLDVKLQRQIIERTLHACHELGMALCWVTHEPSHAFRIGSRILVLHDGQVLQDGTSESVYAAPQTALVAELSSAWPIFWLTAEDQWFPDIAGRLNRSITQIGFRTECFRLSAEEPSSAAWLQVLGDQLRLMANIERCEYLGSFWLVHAKWGCRSIRFLSHFHQPPCGAKVCLTYKLDDILQI